MDSITKLLIATTVAVLVHALALILLLGKYGINKRFFMLLAIIGGIELGALFIVAPCIEYYTVPYLIQLPNGDSGLLIIFLWMTILLISLTTLLALAYFLGDRYGFKPLQAKEEENKVDDEVSY